MEESQVSDRSRTGWAVRGIAWTALALLLAAPAGALEPAPPGVDADAIARLSDDNMRSDRTFFRGRMVVESPRLRVPRSVEFSSWEDRPGKRSLIRIHAPAKDEGSGFLKLHPNMWMYIPRVERTMRIPPSMMLNSWMGSDFTNDDLMRESSEIDDYDHTLLGVEPSLASAGGRRAYVVEYVPHEEAAVVWGRIVAWIDFETRAPLRQEFYDEDGEMLRVLEFSEHRSVDERFVPHRWTLTPLEKEGHRTVIEVESMRFDLDINEAVFTKRNLEKER
jgi:outer membrane lipoprotein-sorting protein